eukprot:scaffold68629_cov38-Phaeocystis_antarctica.AAC.1
MLTNEDGTCAGYLMRDGTTVVADECATPLQPTALLTAALLTTALLTTALLTTALLTTYYALPTTHHRYVSAVPCDIFKRLLPKAWAKMPYFRQVRGSRKK